MATTSRENRDSESIPNKCIHLSPFFSGKKKGSLHFTLLWSKLWLFGLKKEKEKKKIERDLDHWCRHNLVLSNREGFVLNTSAGVKIIFLKGWWEVLKGLRGKNSNISQSDCSQDDSLHQFTLPAQHPNYKNMLCIGTSGSLELIVNDDNDAHKNTY